MKALGASLAAASLILSTLISERPWGDGESSQTSCVEGEANGVQEQERAHLDLSERFASGCGQPGAGCTQKERKGGRIRLDLAGRAQGKGRVAYPAAHP